MITDYENLLVEVSGNVATLTLNRPERMNALSQGMLIELKAALVDLKHREDVRALLIRAAGRGFCAGMDVTAPKSGLHPNDPDAMLRDYYLPMLQLLREYPKPTVAAVQGACIGAGISLALCCDITLAGRSAYFTAAFINMGLCADTGASWVLQRAVGDVRARGMLMLGERVPAPQAAEWGMVWKCLEDDALSAEAEALAAKIGNGPTVAHTQLKKVMRNVAGSSWREHVLLEADAQAIARQSEDAKEARLAFQEKRAPVFRGR